MKVNSISMDRILFYCNVPEKDGVIEIRKEVEDISLGDAKYAQVRIAINNKYFIKGTAIYSNCIQEGYDIVCYTKCLDKRKVLNELDLDSNEPFGVVVHQRHNCGDCIYIVSDNIDWKGTLVSRAKRTKEQELENFIGQLAKAYGKKNNYDENETVGDIILDIQCRLGVTIDSQMFISHITWNTPIKSI